MTYQELGAERLAWVGQWTLLVSSPTKPRASQPTMVMTPFGPVNQLRALPAMGGGIGSHQVLRMRRDVLNLFLYVGTLLLGELCHASSTLSEVHGLTFIEG